MDDFDIRLGESLPDALAIASCYYGGGKRTRCGRRTRWLATLQNAVVSPETVGACNKHAPLYAANPSFIVIRYRAPLNREYRATTLSEIVP